MTVQAVSLASILTERTTGLPADSTLPVVAKVSFDGSMHLRSDSESKTKMIVSMPGDLLVSGINAAKGAITLNRTSTPVAATIHYSSYTIDESRVDPDYLLLLMRSSLFRDILDRSVPGGIKTELKARRLLPLTVDLPDLETQRRTVASVKGAHALIQAAMNQAESTQRQLADLRGSLIAEVVRESHEGGTLGAVLAEKPRNGWSPRCDNQPGGTPVLALGAVTGYVFRPEQVKYTSEPTNPEAAYWVRDGDLLVTRSNTEELVGHAAIAERLPDHCIYPDLMMRLRVDPERADKRFVYYWMMSRPARQHIMGSAKGSNPTMKKINQASLMATPFPMGLSRDAQVRYAALFDEIVPRVVRAQESQQSVSRNLRLLNVSISDTMIAESTKSGLI